MAGPITWQLATVTAVRDETPTRPLVHARPAGLARSSSGPARRHPPDRGGRVQRRAELLDRVRAGARGRDRYHRRAHRGRRGVALPPRRGGRRAIGSRCAVRSAATSSGMRALGGPLFLVAGGSGVVPLMAMLRHRARAGAGVPARLLFSSRHLEEIIYRDELDRLAASGDGFDGRATR